MPSNAEAKRKGKSKGRQVEEEEVPALERLPAEEELEGSKTKCGFCHRPRLPPPLEGGKLYTLKAQGVMAHYFCMLFTYNSHQLGGDSEGLFGFYGGEVRGQVEAAARKKCRYCSTTGATAR